MCLCVRDTYSLNNEETDTLFLALLRERGGGARSRRNIFSLKFWGFFFQYDSKLPTSFIKQDTLKLSWKTKIAYWKFYVLIRSTSRSLSLFSFSTHTLTRTDTHTHARTHTYTQRETVLLKAYPHGFVSDWIFDVCVAVQLAGARRLSHLVVSTNPNKHLDIDTHSHTHAHMSFSIRSSGRKSFLAKW